MLAQQAPYPVSRIPRAGDLLSHPTYLCLTYQISNLRIILTVPISWSCHADQMQNIEMRCKINLVWFLAHFEPPVKGFCYYLTLEKNPMLRYNRYTGNILQLGFIILGPENESENRTWPLKGSSRQNIKLRPNLSLPLVDTHGFCFQAIWKLEWPSMLNGTVTHPQ